MLISVAFWHGILLTAMSRLPLFVLGMIIASYNGCSKIWDGKYSLLLMNIIMVIGLCTMFYFLKQNRYDRWHYGLWWYPFILIVPGLVYDIGICGEIISKIRWIRILSVVVSELGKASFEIFLIHLFIFESAGAKNIEGSVIWLILFIIALVCGYAYRRLVLIFSRQK